MTSRNSPFLVLGAGRGGTTLLAACIAGHPDVIMDMELFGWTHLMGLSVAHMKPERIFDDRVHAFREGCLRKIAKVHPRKWGNKLTTEHLFGLEDHNALNPPYQNLIARFFDEVVPEFQIVFIIRDGRSTIASKVRRTGQSWEHASFRWHYAVQVMKILRTRTRASCIVRFEDLVIEPHECLAHVCEYLGLVFHNAMLQQTNGEHMLPEYRAAQFDKTKLTVAEVPPHVLAFIRPDLEYCGYI